VNLFRRFLLGMAVVGLQLGMLPAAEPDGEPARTAPAARAVDSVSLPPQVPAEYIPGADSEVSTRGGLRGGLGLYIMQPFFENNPSMNIIFQGVSPNFQRVVRVDVAHHMQAAPLVWLGWEGEEGLGGRARWWYFRQGTGQTLFLPPFAGAFNVQTGTQEEVQQRSGVYVTASSATPLGLQAFGDTLSKTFGPEATLFSITTKLELQSGDVEATQQVQAGNWNFLFCGGVRLARIDQTYNAYDAQSTSPAELRTLLSSYVFQGIGPVVALESRRPFGDSGLSLYGSARGAVLFGTAQQNATFGGVLLRNDDPNAQSATQHQNRALPVVEMELGVEYGRTIGGSRAFGQLALVGQDWLGVGSASRSAAATLANAPPALGGTVANSDIAFFGLSIRLGLDY